MINPKDVASLGFRALSDPPEMRVAWTVPQDLPYFEGHFPGNPTLPAVAMVDLTLELVRRWPGFERAELSLLKTAKFASVIGPGDSVEVSLTRDLSSPLVASGVEWRAEWKLNSRGAGDGVAAVTAASFWLGVRA